MSRAHPVSILVFSLLLTVVSSFLARYSLLQTSGLEAFSFAGERLFSSLDSYYWLAGAEDFGGAAGSMLSELLDLVRHTAGIPITEFAFWSPVFFACLPLFLIALVCFRAGYPEAGIVSGVFGVNAPLYLIRTSASRFDTDFIAVLGPVGLVTGLILLLYPYLKSKTRQEEEFSLKAFMLCFAGILLLGFWCKLYLALYPQGKPIITGVFVFSMVSSWLWLPWKYIPALIAALLFSFGIGSVLWMQGVGLFVLGCGILLIFGLFRNKTLLVSILLAVPALLLAWLVKAPRHLIAYRENLVHLIKNVQGQDYLSPAGLALPSIFTSISESIHVSFTELFGLAFFHHIFFLILLVAYVLLCIRYRFFILFLPFLALAIAGKYLGFRFAIYGNPVMALSLGFGISFLFRRFKTRYALLAQIAVAVLIIPLLLTEFKDKKLEPIVDTPTIRALTELKAAVPEKAQLWTWWDLGYPAQYYARKKTYAHGGWGMNQRKVIPLATLYMTDSPATGQKIIEYAASGSIAWSEIRRGQTTSLERWIAEQTEPIKATPPQYLVLTLNSLNKTNWMSYYANWNFQDARSHQDNVLFFKKKVDVLKNGILQTASNRFTLNTMLYVDAFRRLRKKSFGNMSGIYAVAVAKHGTYVFHRELYDSLLVQMLFTDPSSFKPHFELVYDDYPFVRVYKVVQKND